MTSDLPAQLTFLSLFAIGHYYYSNGELANALETIKSATDALILVEKKPEGLAEVYFRLGWLYQSYDSNHNQAIEAYDKAIFLDSDFSAAYYNRGIAFSILKKYKSAMEDYNQYIKTHSNDAAAYISRGNNYARLGKYELAMLDYSRAIEIRPNNPIVYYNRAIAYLKLNNINRANRDYQKFKYLAHELDIEYKLQENYIIVRREWLKELPFDYP